MSDLTVQLHCAKWRDLNPRVEDVAARAARAALARLGALQDRLESSELTLVLADAALTRQLNSDFRGQDKPTNVLSFCAPQSAPQFAQVSAGACPPPYLGDVILSYETIIEEAREQGKNPADHLCHLIVHGVLHLFGFDHDTDQKTDEMEKLEITILKSLGIDNPYAIDGDAGGAAAARITNPGACCG